MAIYNNREVSIVHPLPVVAAPPTIVVRYPDGTHETVSRGRVYFTEQEKKDLTKAYPSEFDNVNVISEDDVKAVRVGVAPSIDPDRKVQVEQKALQTKAAEENKKQMDKVNAEVQKKVTEGDKKVEKK